MQGRRSISPATAIAIVALVVAMGGAAYAGSKVDTRELATGAVTAKKLAAGSVKTKKLANNAVKTGKIADNTITGNDINESTLGQVPSAQSAESAANADNADTVGGLAAKKFFVVRQPGSAVSSFGNFGTLTLQAGCENDGDPLLTVVPADAAAPQAVRASVVIGGSNLTLGTGQGTLPDSGLAILDGTTGGITNDGSIEAATSAGLVTTIQWAARGPALFPTGNPEPNTFACILWGTALAG